MLKIKESPITSFKNLIKSKKNTIDLTIGEPFFKTPFIVKIKTCLSILNNNTRYTSKQGNIKLINEILKYEYKFNNYKFNTDNVLITNGSSSSIYLSLKTILNSTNEVIVLSPAYPDYEQILDITNNKIVYFDTTPFNYQIDFNELNKLITKNTKCIIINSPNNPTGVVYNIESINNVYKIVKKYNLYLILDNCYVQLSRVQIPNFSKYLDIYNNLIICGSFSKSYSMTGWRLGYLIGNKDLIKNATLINQAINICIPPFIQKGAIYCFSYNLKKRTKIYLKHLNYAYNKLIKMGLDVYKPEGAIYLFPSIKNYHTTSFSFCSDLLNNCGVAVLPGEIFNDDTHIRINFLVSFKNLRKGLNLLEKYLDKIKKEQN